MKHLHPSLLIAGTWVEPATAATIQVRSPTTEEILGEVPDASEVDMDRAVDAARRAFDDPTGWSRWQPAERAAALVRLAEALEKRGPETARLVSSQNGMPLQLSLASEAVAPAGLLRYYAYLAEATPLEEQRASFTGGTTTVRREPAGVVAAIVPWNYPQTLSFFKLAPALAAGCTVVLKPAPETVLDAYVLAEAVLEAGLPAGVLNIVPAGREVGAYLVQHPGVDKVAFTGSTAAGRAIAEVCGRLLRPVTLELGGKSAAIVLDDADLAAFAAELLTSCLLNNGQTCYLGTRILAPRSRYADTVAAIEQVARDLEVGDPLSLSTQVGPVSSDRQRSRVEHYIGLGVQQGARLVTGGRRPPHLQRGFFVEPTVFADVDNSSAIAREEIFGPVVCVIAYDDDRDAVRLANDSPYGLGGSVWTTDVARGLEIARQVHTGSIGINGYAIDIGSPFGGVKDSGLGRELGPEGLSAYQQLKSVYH